MTLSRSPIKRRRAEPRRTEHPFPLPTGEPVTAADVREGQAFGVQAELCRSTVCAACFSQWWRRVHGPAAIDWTQLPTIVGGQRSHPHHEPPRGTALGSGDDATIPLCDHHHVGGFVSRHASKWSNLGGKAFYAHFNICYQDVRDEMRRRVALTPATVSET